MFTADTLIDTVQTGKKNWINTFVTNQQIAEALNHFVDSQTDYTKKAYKATNDAASEIIHETIAAYQNAAKFDYVKFGEGIMKAYSATTKTK